MFETGSYVWQLLKSPLRFKEIVAPTAAQVPTNTVALYAKDKSGVSDLYFKDDAGVEHDIGLLPPTPQALTRINDTNITLTLGGSPTTALLAATSLTLGWTGQLGLTRGGTAASLTAADGGVVYSNATTLAINTPGSLGDWLKSAGAGTPVWTAPAALTKTDDTNVTLTLGGSASTALLNAASLTLGWTGTLAVSRGGTGQSTVAGYNALLDHGTLLGLADDDHTQYALLAGRSGGQTLIGGTASGDDLTLQSTSNSTKGTVVVSGIPLSNTEQGFRVGTQQNGLGARNAVMMIGESLANSNTTTAAFWITTNFTGAGNQPLGCYAQPTFVPSASISDAYGFLGDPIFAPPTGVTITNAQGLFARTIYSGSVGAVTNGFTLVAETPINATSGTLTSGTQYGLIVKSQGMTGMTTAVGVQINAQSGATNNYDMGFGTVDTTAAGAYYGRLPVLYNGLKKYIHVFSA